MKIDSEIFFEKKSASGVPVRGFMLDISRGRVPKMEELFGVVELLARLGYNQFQLYVEHTFAFKNHETVWRDASPIFPEEIRALDAFCRSRGIEFVPNLNSFGHVERWLKHEKYKHLAECPDGFFHEIFKMQRAAGTFAATPESADFMGELYREFLPNFSSEKFNIGGDEPWELGQGRSRERCARLGKRAVYLEHMARLKKHATACGKKIMFWGDVLLGDAGEISTEFLQGTVPVIWGYDAGHPFSEQCSRVRSALEKTAGTRGAGEFYLAPGTSAWLSFGTRQTNAFANICEACDVAKKFDASGVLLTTWGDFGYHNMFSANLLPLVYFAKKSRGETFAPTAENFALALKALDFPNAEIFATVAFAFGKLDDFISKKITNRSWIREIFFASGNALPALMNGVPAEEIFAAKTECSRVLEILKKSENSSEKTVRVNDGNAEFVAHCSRYFTELRLSVEMSLAALNRAEAFLKKDESSLAQFLTNRAGTFCKRFAEVWRSRDRDGGLAESLSYF